MADSSEKLESWMNRTWRPAMAWMYFVVCITDFIAYPIWWAIFQDLSGISPVKPWDPITLQGAGLFHMAMGAILGITAWSRGQEKIQGVAGPVINRDRENINTKSKPTQPDQPEL
jgi:hypothetical protein